MLVIFATCPRSGSPIFLPVTASLMIIVPIMRARDDAGTIWREFEVANRTFVALEDKFCRLPVVSKPDSVNSIAAEVDDVRVIR